MIFQSRYKNHAFVIRPAVRVIHPGVGTEFRRGLQAVFSGQQRLFDSEKAQRELGWTDEEREQVEDYLLSHPEFNVTFFLAYGQEIPEEKVGLVKNLPPMRVRKCMQITAQDGEIVQCKNPALPGIDYCADHNPDVQRIVKGGVQQK